MLVVVVHGCGTTSVARLFTRRKLDSSEREDHNVPVLAMEESCGKESGEGGGRRSKSAGL